VGQTRHSLVKDFEVLIGQGRTIQMQVFLSGFQRCW
jgi:hypothetical protein